MICAKMRTILGIVLCLSVVNLPYASGGCTWPFKRVYIDDTATNEDIYEYTADEDFEFKGWVVTQADGGLGFENALTYFQDNITDRTFKIKTTEEFGNLNSDAYTDGTSVLTITLVVTLTCGETTADSILLVAVTNTNQNAPEFSQESYSYSLPMPIMPKTDFSLFGDEGITATDIDFSTNDIIFSVDPDDFAVTSLQTANKTFRAVFSANKILRFTESQIYTLTASDSGTPAKTTAVTITLNVDPTAGLDAPAFSSPYYSYNYTGGDTLIPTSGAIIIESDKSSEAKYALTGDYSDSFTVDFKNETKTFSISLKPDTSLPVEGVTQFVLTLSYTTDANINAVILITIVKDETKPEFSKNYYIGTYDIKTNIISWIEPVAIKDASKVELFGDKSSLFEVNSTTYEITSINTIPTTDFDENSNLFLTLIASLGSFEARATVVISLPSPDELKFDSSYYYGEYKIENEKGVVSLVGDIGFSDITDFTGITVAVDDSYSGNFKIELDPSVWKVTVLFELNSTTLNAFSELAIPITATKSGETTTSTAILILTLPDKVEIKFTDLSYTANYIIGSGTDPDTVVLDKGIIVEGAEANKISITPEDYSGNFEVVYDTDSSSYKVNVKANLDASTLDTETQLIITITATETDAGVTANTILVLALPEKTSSLTFEKRYYAAEYIVDDTSIASVKFTENSIKIYGADVDKLTFKFEDYDPNFEMEYNTTSTSYNIIVKANLNSSILDSKTQLIITLTANVVDADVTTNTVVVLALPEKKSSFNFENKHYAAEYILDTTSKASVKLIDASIKVGGANYDKIQFDFEGYNNNFVMEYDTTSSSYNINVQNNLDSTILDSETQLIITITATETDEGATANTVLILALPEQTKLINFEENHYAAEYILDTESIASVKLADTIKVTGAESDKITFKFEEYDDNFEMQYDTSSSSYKINVKNNLNSSILASGTQLIITITATEADEGATANTVLILALPEPTKLINFEENHYAAEYIVDTESTASVKLADTIKVTGAESDKITFKFEEYDDNFEMQYDTSSSSYKINVKNNLNSSILASGTQLIITITATEADEGATANTVLILALPEPTKLINFEENHYAAEYIVDTESTASVKLADTIKVTGAESDKITFKFEEYDDNFEMQYDTSSSSYKINVKNNLNSSILASGTQLIITITATEADEGATANTVLILALPEPTKLINFEENHYAAEYIVDTESTASVKLADTIKVTGAESDKITFKFEEYDDNFEMQYDTSSSSYKINVKNNLNSSILASGTQLIITITATEADEGATANTVLILALPEPTKLINFEENHYAAEYIVDTESTASVKLADTIKVTGAESDKITFKFEEYDDNFEMQYDTSSSSYKINVKNNLNSSILASGTQLIITITATEADEGATANTVLILALPEPTKLINFEENHYAAEYIVDTESTASVKLADTIKVTGAESDKITFKFEEYDDNFEMQYDTSSSSYKINVKNNLNSSILASGTQLIITITATEADEGATANTVLILELPEPTKLINFEENHYAAEYIVDTQSTASVKLADTIKVTGAESDKITFKFEEYDDNFEMLYNISSSSYKINVKNNLNSSILASGTQLIITITATEADEGATANTVLILALPEPTKLINFEENHYAAEYIVDTESTASVKLADTIKVTGAESDKISFKFEEYDDNFEMQYDTSSSSYKINVKNNLNSSILASGTQLIITITATEADEGATANTVLILALPEETTSLSFEDTHYTAEYIIDTSPQIGDKIIVNIIKVTGADPEKIEFNFEGYNDNFEMDFNTTSSSYNILVKVNLNSSTLASATQLIITLTAIETDAGATASTILVLALPEKAPSLNFEKKHYAAEYILDTTSKASVKLTDNGIKVTGVGSDIIQFTFEGYNDNFEMEYDTTSSSYNINVKSDLDTTILDINTQLLITITANTRDATGSTVLVLKLPEKTFAFQEQQYTATYVVISESEGSVLLDKNIVITDAASLDLKFSFIGYEEHFDLKWDETTLGYKVTVNKPLDDNILSSNTQLVVSVTAFASGNDGLTASTVLVLKLPLDKNSLPAFQNNYYVATYKLSSTSDQDQIEINPDIKIKSADFAAVALSIEGYDDNFIGTCESSTLLCTISVKTNLNSTILSTKTELLLTVDASNKDESRVGKTVLLLKLPTPKNSTFAFTKQHYSASYAIEATDGGVATVTLTDTILFDGVDASELTINADEYSDQFSFVFDTTDTTWKVVVKRNLDSDILSKHTELIISLTATKTKDEYDKATLVIKLPDKTTMAFLMPQYTGEYLIDGSPKVVLTPEIETTDHNIQITLDDYVKNFEVTLSSESKWTINVITPLGTTIFTENSQLKLLMTITKAGVKYGEAALIINLPDSSFSEGFYTATYTDDNEGASISSDDITVLNVEAADIQVILAEYNKYIYTELVDSKWVFKVSQALPGDITQNNEVLLTTLQAIRKSDSQQLTSSALLIKLPKVDSAGAPTFTQFTFYGDYKNSSTTSSVDLAGFIGFTNSDKVTVSSVFIEEGSSNFSTNFKVISREDKTYDIEVSQNLPEDVLNTESSLVLTLVASTAEGKKGYATLVINLPKVPRDTSVHFEDERFLYSGTYENGTFKSPPMTIKTNSTDDKLIDVVITNELGIADTHFSSTLENNLLTVSVDNLPVDILSQYAVIPLKLAITDTTTGDTVHAVLNVNINYKTDDGDDPVTHHDYNVGLLAAVIILAILLIAVIVAVILLWYFKIRNARYVKMEEEEIEKSTKPTFTKNLNRQTSSSVPSISSLRRPTGLPIGFVRSESPTEEASSDFVVSPTPPPVIENEKKVAFNENVQNIDDDENEIDDEEPANLQNVADRRPTQYVFGNPMATVFDSPLSERRESSDYIGYDPDIKKSVVFDDNVERMHIDVDDANNSGDEEDKESYNVNDDDDLKLRFKAELEVKLEEEFPNETFNETL